jgi:hypothetical protein
MLTGRHHGDAEVDFGFRHVQWWRRVASKSLRADSVPLWLVPLRRIPPEAYEYVVNGKSPIEWVMERYQVTKDKDSQLLNDPNAWCSEIEDPLYIINLVKRVVTVSLETVAIVKALPPIDELGRRDDLLIKSKQRA